MLTSTITVRCLKRFVILFVKTDAVIFNCKSQNSARTQSISNKQRLSLLSGITMNLNADFSIFPFGILNCVKTIYQSFKHRQKGAIIGQNDIINAALEI